MEGFLPFFDRCGQVIFDKEFDPPFVMNIRLHGHDIPDLGNRLLHAFEFRIDFAKYLECFFVLAF